MWQREPRTALRAGITVAYKMIEEARSGAGPATPPLVALVRAGALFHGKLLERPVDLASEPSPDTSVSEVA